MDSKLYFTIAAIVAILFGVAFVLAPAQVSSVYGLTPNPTSVLSSRFFGSALLAWGVILWLARDFSEAAAIRGVLIGSVVGEVVGGAVNVWGTVRGLLTVSRGPPPSFMSCCSSARFTVLPRAN
jgi:uncharacterized protein YjeT (DUF2065 family)